MRHICIYLLTIVALSTVVSCRQVPVVEVAQAPSDPLGDNRINANRIIAQSEETQIDAYAARRGWKMQPVAGGARIWMERGELKAEGEELAYGDTLKLEYDVETIGGERIYSGVCDTVVVGRAKPCRGVDEALLYLPQNGKATVVVPSEQGFGVAGDGDKIVSRTVLVYRLEVTLIR